MLITDHRRKQSIIYLALAILGIGILAAGLSDLTFESGLAIPGSAVQSSGSSTEVTRLVQNDGNLPWLFQGMLGIGLVLLFFVFLVALFKKASKKRIGLTAAGLALLAVIFFILPQVKTAQQVSTQEDPSASLPLPYIYNIAPIGDPPSALVWFIVAGLVLVALGVCIWLLRMASRESQNEDLLALQAASAIQAIEAGQDIKNVIIRCYLQMERVVQEEKGFERKDAVTPREFEQYLVTSGIPNPPVIELTRLFEQARYGNQACEPKFEQDAIHCLTSIRTACQQRKEGIR
jgi:4-amino-4-deoxy-L-arabinose transferase-like glycosyltransferase